MSESTGGGVTERLRTNYETLTSAQKRIAEAIIDDPEFVAFATLDKLASRLGVAPSTIVRFSYKLGLDGYPDLQERIRAQVRRQFRSVGETEASGSLTGHLDGTPFRGSLDRDVDHLQRTVASLRKEELERAVSLLSEAEKVYVTADLTTYSLAHFSAIVLGRARQNVRLVQADAMGASALLDVSANDVLLAYTFPPYSRNVLRVVDWAIGRGAATIGVTDAAISPVGQRVSVVLSALASGVGPQNTLVSGMAVANALINGVIDRIGDDALDRYAAVGDIGTQWDRFVLGSDNG